MIRFIPRQGKSVVDFSASIMRSLEEDQGLFRLLPDKVPRVVEPIKDRIFSASLTKALPKGIKGTWFFSRRSDLEADAQHDDWIQFQYPAAKHDFDLHVLPSIVRIEREMKPYLIQVISEEGEFEALDKIGISDVRNQLLFLPPAGFFDNQQIERLGGPSAESRLLKICSENEIEVQRIKTGYQWRPRNRNVIERLKAMPWS